MSRPRRRALVVAVVVAVVALVVALVVAGLAVVYVTARSTSESSAPAPSGTPAVAPSGAPSTPGYPVPKAATGPSGGLMIASPAGAKAPVLDAYLDPQCMWCRQAHEALSQGLDEAVAQGRIRLVVHLHTVLDDNLANDASARVARAAACASDAQRLGPFLDAVFAGQPETEGQGFTDAQITTFADQAGIRGPAKASWARCVAERRYARYIEAAEATAPADRVRGTPTYRYLGRQVDLEPVLPPGRAPDPDAFFHQIGL